MYIYKNENLFTSWSPSDALWSANWKWWTQRLCAPSQMFWSIRSKLRQRQWPFQQSLNVPEEAPSLNRKTLCLPRLRQHTIAIKCLYLMKGV